MNKMRAGYLLVENLISLAAVSLIIPTVLIAFTSGLSQRQRNVHESNGVSIATQIFTELPTAWRFETSLLFPNLTPFPFPQIDLSESLESFYDPTGGLLTNKEGALYLASLTKEGEGSPLLETERTARFVIEVSYPVHLPALQRKRFRFTRLFRRP